jgi:hypothetical protein
MIGAVQPVVKMDTNEKNVHHHYLVTLLNQILLFIFYLLPAFLGVFTPSWGVVCLMSLFSDSAGRMIVLIHIQHFLFEHHHYQHYKIHHQKNLIEQSH